MASEVPKSSNRNRYAGLTWRPPECLEEGQIKAVGLRLQEDETGDKVNGPNGKT